MTYIRSVLVGFLLSMLSTSALYAQTSQPVATGKVVEPGGQPVGGGVPLQVQGPAGKTVVFTDPQGKWSLYNLPAGTYKVAPLSGPAAAEQTVQFSVKDKGLVDKLFGTDTPTYSASDIKLK